MRARHTEARFAALAAVSMVSACSVGTLQFDLTGGTGATGSGGHGGAAGASSSGAGTTASSASTTSASSTSSASASSTAASSSSGTAATCMDGMVDGQETDVDCGGMTCPRCAQDRNCLVDSDCVSGFCKQAVHRCKPTSCSDGVKDGTETDVDCGGSCLTKCGTGKGCAVAADCASGLCFVGSCM